MLAENLKSLLSLGDPIGTGREARYLLDRVGETPPYMSIEHVFVDGDRVFGVCKRQQARYSEVSSLSCSEAARVMALQGCLAAAHSNPNRGRHYYLAVKGNCQWESMRSLLPHSDEFVLIARPRSSISQRNMVSVDIECRTCFGERYASMQCRYLVMGQEVFFASMGGRGETPQSGGNPYRNPRRLENLRYLANEDRVEANLPRMGAEDFAGHFDNCALCPVAVLGDNMNGLIDAFPDVGRYAVRELSFWCKEVSRPGDRPRLIGERKHRHHYLLSALDDIGDTFFALDVHLDKQATEILGTEGEMTNAI